MVHSYGEDIDKDISDSDGEASETAEAGAQPDLLESSDISSKQTTPKTAKKGSRCGSQSHKRTSHQDCQLNQKQKA